MTVQQDYIRATGALKHTHAYIRSKSFVTHILCPSGKGCHVRGEELSIDVRVITILPWQICLDIAYIPRMKCFFLFLFVCCSYIRRPALIPMTRIMSFSIDDLFTHKNPRSCWHFRTKFQFPSYIFLDYFLNCWSSCHHHSQQQRDIFSIAISTNAKDVKLK
jgi:hypothetical protein